MDDAKDLLDPHVLAESGLEKWQESTALHASLNAVRAGDLVHGRYQVKSVLGAERYKVVHLGTEQLFELRRIPTLLENSRAWRRLEIVTSAASVVANENLGFVADFDVCMTFGGFVVGEWVEGELLTAILKDKRQLELEEVLAFVLEIGHALGTLHDLGLGHGLLNTDDIIRDSEGHWRLLMPGAPPAQMNIGKAPELQNFYAASPLSDQFGFAYITWSLLVGAAPDIPPAFGPSDLRADVPEGLDEAILKALSSRPDNRWRSMDELQARVQFEVGEWRKPVIDSFDASEASRLLKMHPDTTSHPKSFDREASEVRSAVVRFHVEKEGPPEINFTFNKLGRLRREYRRNIVTGSIFIPTPNKAQVGDEIQVTLHYQPTSQEVKLRGKVKAVEVGDETKPPGLGVVLEKNSHQMAMRFVRDIDPFSSLTAEAVIEPRTDFSLEAKLSGTEAFVLGRIAHPMSLGQVRGLFAGMPFDVDEIVLSLVEAGFLNIRDSGDAMEKREHTGRISKRVTTIKYQEIAMAKLNQEDVDEIVERVIDYQRAGNFRAASELLESTLRSHEDHRLLYHLATIEGRFHRAFARALQHIERALELAPGTVEYIGLQKWLNSVTERKGFPSIYRATVKDARFFFVWNFDDQIWIDVQRPDISKRRLVRIDAKEADIKETRKIAEAIAAEVTLIPSKTGPVPRYYSGPKPLSWTTNARFMLTEKDEEGQAGLFLAKAGFRQPQRVDSDDSEFVRAALAPDSSGAVAWISTGKKASLWLTEYEGRSRKSIDLDSLAFVTWTQDSSTAVVVEELSGQVVAVDRQNLAMFKLGRVAPHVHQFAADGEHKTGVSASRDANGYLLTWFDLETGSHLATQHIRETPQNLLVRGDGFVCIRTKKEVLLLNLKSGLSLALEHEVGPEVFELGNWLLGTPLYMIPSAPQTLEIFKIEPALLQE